MLLPRGCEFSDIISRKGKKQSISECPKIIHFIIREPGGGWGGRSQDNPAKHPGVNAGRKTEIHQSCALLYVGAGSRWLF